MPLSTARSIRILAILFGIMGLLAACQTPRHGTGPAQTVRTAGPAPSTVSLTRTVQLAPREGAYAGWSAMVIAGDNKAGNGNPTRAFDNARREISERLVRIGFARDDMVHLSADPDILPDTPAYPVSLARFRKELALLKNRTSRGCLFYFTSHGVPEGLIMGDETVAPKRVWAAIERFCGDQPTMVVVSACFSGSFADSRWHADNRYIFTAARPDRSSFGCGEDDIYPFFDGCILTSLDEARDWIDLVDQTKRCVTRREEEEDMTPPSEPQFAAGQTIRELLLQKPFPRQTTNASVIGPVLLPTAQ